MIKACPMLRFALPFIGIIAFSSVQAELAPWSIDYEQSKVSFFAKQAGAEFEGHWDQWTAEVRFDPQDLAQSHALAHFRVSSLATFDRERDATLLDPEWFDGGAHPIATFEAREFEMRPDGGFLAASELEVKGLRTPLTFQFEVREEDGMQVLRGEAEIDRLAARIGTGEWLDTTWIGQFVRVEVILYATTPVISSN